MTYKDRDIFSFHLPQSHVKYGDDNQAWWTNYAFVRAAHFKGMIPSDFRRLPVEDQAEIVADMMVTNQLEAVIADERHKEMVRKSQRRG